ncbi:hypothetical protein [Chamaesiphon sp.]|uniref:hypothetical protein n=1 Tax=Chamaesiphon sp. TaxID=2814140 RepID=UPI00359409EE
MARPKRQKIKLAIDFGGSSTKAIIEIDDRSIPLVMSPEVIEIGTIDLDNYRHQSSLDLWHRSFVGVKDRYFAIGELAVSLGATQALKRLKSETIVYKLLAIVSVFAQRLELGNSFDLELGCLLPPGEFAERERLQIKLLDALSDFDTPLGRFTVRTIEAQYHPEGMGVAHLYHINRPHVTGKVGTIMAGHRNISCYVMQGRQPVKKATSDLGFQSWIELIIDRTSGYEFGTLSIAVARYWTDNDKIALGEILRHRDAVEREFELEHLVKVIKSTHITYWRAINDWLDDKFPSVEEVMLSGGVADVLKADFIAYLKERLPTRADCGNRQGIFNDRVFKQIPDLGVPNGYQSRFADVYCLSQYLMTRSVIKTRS